MTARPGDSFPTDLIFPPFAPRTAPQAPASPAAPQAQAPAPEAAPAEEPAEQGWEAPEAGSHAEELESAEVEETGGFAETAGEMPWDLPEASGADDAAVQGEEAQDELGDDLPWLELPGGPPAAESADAEPWQAAAEDAFAAPEAFALPEADEAPGGFAGPDAELEAEPEAGDDAADAGETVPDWMAWDPGAAAVTEAPEIPPPGDVEAAAAARETEAVDAQALAGSLEGLESFDRPETADVEPVSGLAPVGDFDVPSEPPAAYETPDWAQPTAEWAAPSAPMHDAAVDGGFGASSMEAELTAELRGIVDAPGADEAETAGAVESVYDLPPVADAAADSADLAAEETPAAPVAAAAPGDDRLSGMLGEVADRLESIARSLRERSPAEVLAGPRDGSADPLELLVTGFVLGYLQRGGGR